MAQNTVLVPIDGSEFSARIIPHLAKFLSPHENEIILLRVLAPPEGHVGYPARIAAPDTTFPSYDSARDVEQAAHPIYASQERASLEGLARSEMQSEIDRLKMAGFSVKTAILFGDAASEIVNYIRQHEIDLVALATHWRQGLDRLIRGSVARHVLGHVSTPVLLVHPDAPQDNE